MVNYPKKLSTRIRKKIVNLARGTFLEFWDYILLNLNKTC